MVSGANGALRRLPRGFPDAVSVGSGAVRGKRPETQAQASAGRIKRSQLRDIAETKMKDLNANDLDAATKIIEGSARAMGLDVVEG